MLVGFERPAQSYQRFLGILVLEELYTFPELSRRIELSRGLGTFLRKSEVHGDPYTAKCGLRTNLI